MHDVIVVGAGPSGSYAAMKCAKLGLEVLLIDSEEFPRDKACGGVVGWDAMNLIGKDIHSIAEAEADQDDFFYDWRYIGSLTEREFFFKRREFDYYLVQRAVDAGATLIEDVTANSVSIMPGSAVVNTSKGDLPASMVIGADGINSAMGRSLGMTHLNDHCRYASIKAEIDITHSRAKQLGIRDPSRQQTHFFPDLVGFAWLIPNKNSVNAGYGSTVDKAGNLRERFHLFLKVLDLKPQLELGAQIPFRTLRRVYAERALLTGDAGGFVNPWTGAGITQGILASDKAATVCKMAIDSQDFSIQMMSRYQRLCKGQIKHINWRAAWIKALDGIMPVGREFPFWVRFFIRRLATMA